MFPNGKIDSVSTHDIAPCPNNMPQDPEIPKQLEENPDVIVENYYQEDDLQNEKDIHNFQESSEIEEIVLNNNDLNLRRSTRPKYRPNQYGFKS